MLLAEQASLQTAKLMPEGSAVRQVPKKTTSGKTGRRGELTQLIVSKHYVTLPHGNETGQPHLIQSVSQILSESHH